MSQKVNENDFSVDEAWKKLIEKYNIIDEVEKNGQFIITAKQIKEFKEPRLMAKWDSSESLPSSLKENKLNILPNSRNSYIISDFILYKEIPELEENVLQMTSVKLPEYETIDINNISSEANAINVLVISNILDNFLQTEENVATFNGRMGTGTFDFQVNTFKNIKRKVTVNNAQCEIDGGFENENSVVILEAKNVIHQNFHVRQLYYPYRLWKNRVKKPIRLVFSIYSNMIYRLFEYRFNEFDDYSSIELVNSKNYSLQDITITQEDLRQIREKTKIKTDDNRNNTRIPFIQANSMDRIISLLENLYNNPLTEEQVAELMNFETRQSGYYYNAGRYLGLFQKSYQKENEKIVIKLTSLGKKVFKLNYKDRQLKLVELILEHEIFSYFFDEIFKTGTMPEKLYIIEKMKQLNVCSNSLMNRRASSVQGWLKWIFILTKLHKEDI